MMEYEILYEMNTMIELRVKFSFLKGKQKKIAKKLKSYEIILSLIELLLFNDKVTWSHNITMLLTYSLVNLIGAERIKRIVCIFFGIC
jgi:hypothetical protein